MRRHHAISPGFSGHYRDLGIWSRKRHVSACSLILSVGRSSTLGRTRRPAHTVWPGCSEMNLNVCLKCSLSIAFNRTLHVCGILYANIQFIISEYLGLTIHTLRVRVSGVWNQRTLLVLATPFCWSNSIFFAFRQIIAALSVYIFEFVA